jgi:hypothetical protein
MSTGLDRSRSLGSGVWRLRPHPSPSAHRDTGRFGGTKRDRAVGARMAEVFFAIGVAYAVVVVAGFVSLGNLSKPLADPYLGIAEGLIIVMAPVMVMLMVAIYACAPASAKTMGPRRAGMDAGRGGDNGDCALGAPNGRAASQRIDLPRLRTRLQLRVAIGVLRRRHRRLGRFPRPLPPIRGPRVPWRARRVVQKRTALRRRPLLARRDWPGRR